MKCRYDRPTEHEFNHGGIGRKMAWLIFAIVEDLIPGQGGNVPAL